jgi:hypothetical protein
VDPVQDVQDDSDLPTVVALLGDITCGVAGLLQLTYEALDRHVESPQLEPVFDGVYAIANSVRRMIAMFAVFAPEQTPDVLAARAERRSGEKR